MTLLVTGAAGFVMSVLTRHWLEADADARVVTLDVAPFDQAAQRYFAPFKNRMKVVTSDIVHSEQWLEALGGEDIRHVVHGATVTPISRGSAAEARGEPEAAFPRRIIDANVMGTVALLDWARTLRRPPRVIYVSSGAVYKHHGPDRPGEPLPEDGYVMPRRLYGISKLASELITERYGDLFGIEATSVRLSSVYGTMDRITASRNHRHVPNRIAHMAVEGVECVRVNSLAGVGDYVHSEDVAGAIVALLQAPALRYSAYNIAQGCTTTMGELVEWAAEKAPGFHAAITADSEADILQDPTLTDGMWGAYDISRITIETGWRPRPVREALHAYMQWIQEHERA
jgi:UDP-glucose 4-epimerase